MVAEVACWENAQLIFGHCYVRHGVWNTPNEFSFPSRIFRGKCRHEDHDALPRSEVCRSSEMITTSVSYLSYGVRNLDEVSSGRRELAMSRVDVLLVCTASLLTVASTCSSTQVSARRVGPPRAPVAISETCYYYFRCILYICMLWCFPCFEAFLLI